MLSLDRAVALKANAGESLNTPWQTLNPYAVPRRGQVTMLYGPSGSCKSMMTLDYILALQLPTLYISPDTDQHDMAIRCMCRLEGMSSTAVEEGLECGALSMRDSLGGLKDWLRFSFDPAPTVRDVDLELWAFEEQFGKPPDVLVLDTLSDVQADDEEEFRGFRKTMKAAHIFARETNALVIVIHHTTGEYDDVSVPAPRRAINGKLSKVPELILSIAKNDSLLGVAIVKQRQGFQDQRAESPVWLNVDAARATVTDRLAVPTYY